MSSPSRRRDSKTAIQGLLGVLVLVAWVLIDATAFEDTSVARSLTVALPFLIAYEAGVFSRYLPGMNWLAKRVK